ncbi:MAG: hypothetical protein C5B47_08100 [Verrucomicrobia bacterium]|nr:MAG: hypothetical protein C5B47_08100 [Verrucomicrobiota bacterium]
MKVDVKDLQKALDWLRKEGGNPAVVDINFDFLHRLEIHSCTDLAGTVVIKIYEAESARMAELTKTERL